ncbi:hypothetical protein [Hymenobacter arizonensis]|uniref:Uncharacterized protein n=1 Tax=Hymenobacter arizonensis TaxID=1227077 RepID=A0A1I6BJR6_HYMAR|nr:hypothetical protein [Hymenobacter arizonensis]SFQ81163.1 hypothetical protein SAMN04515668_4628 [Hymenobacter arizonensis]
MSYFFPPPGQFNEGADLLTQPTTLRRHLYRFGPVAPGQVVAEDDHSLLTDARLALYLLLEVDLLELLYAAAWCLLTAWPTQQPVRQPQPLVPASLRMPQRRQRARRQRLISPSCLLPPLVLALLPA